MLPLKRLARRICRLPKPGVRDDHRIVSKSSELSPRQAEKKQTVELTAIILTYNEEANIQACVSSLHWADRVVVYDSFSNDETVALARQAGAEIGQTTFQNYAQQRNAALDPVATDWVFFVDADERGTEDLGREIRELTDDCKEAGFYVPRHNYIFNRLTKGAGWFPDYQFRLFRHGKVRYERPVHEIANVEGDIGYLRNPLLHYNYRDVDQFHSKQASYTDYDASILFEKGIQPKFHTIYSQPLRHFWWRFITLKGYQDGFHGFRLSAYMAYYEWIKYRKLSAMWADQMPDKEQNKSHIP